MKKINVLTKNWEFQEIILEKKQFVNRHLILYYRKAKYLKIGISIPKKFANAVKRNYIKRQIRHIIDLHYKKLISLLKFEIVIIVRKTYLDLSFKEKEHELIKLFYKLREKG